MSNTPNEIPNNRLVLIHWEPVLWDRLPPERDAQILLELVTSALMYREVMIKDTDLILNRRIIKMLLDSNNFSIFTEFIRLGLVRILVRPLDQDRAETGLDRILYPLTVRAFNIRSRGDQPWTPNEQEKRFYSAVDDILRSSPSSLKSVQEFPQDINPFALWLGDLLEAWEVVPRVPEFQGIDQTVAKRFVEFCREEGEWLSFLGEKNPALVRPGDEDRRFFRSQAYRCLSQFECNHEGMENLIQSVFNSCYCHWEDAAGTFQTGHLVEPPYLFKPDEESQSVNDLVGLQLIPTASTPAILKPQIVEVIKETRESRSKVFDNFQIVLNKMKKGLVPENVAREALKQLADEFARNAQRREKFSSGHPWIIGWALLSASAAIAAAVGFQPQIAGVVGAVSGLMTIGPMIQKAYRSHLRVKALTKSMLDACRFRGSYLHVPEAINRLKRQNRPA